MIETIQWNLVMLTVFVIIPILVFVAPWFLVGCWIVMLVIGAVATEQDKIKEN